MTIRAMMAAIVQQNSLNFLLTNRIPRRLATRFIGWFSRIENPLVCHVSLRVWRLFTDLDLSEAEQTQFRSMHDCFTRKLMPGVRPIETDTAVLTSPCDAIVGACGTVADGQILQVKGSAYSLAELLDDVAHARSFRDGRYVTLRLTSAMYHRFHAPQDCRIISVTHIPGDVWNVNPAALRRVPRLFCRNERAVIRTTLCATGQAVTLVPVAAILVAGIRLAFMEGPLGRGKTADSVTCDIPFRKGEEIGWFEHGSTIVVLAPSGFSLCDGVREGVAIRMGRGLMQLAAPA